VKREHTKTSLVRDESGNIVKQETTTEIITEVVKDRVIERVIFDSGGKVSRSGWGAGGGGADARLLAGVWDELKGGGKAGESATTSRECHRVQGGQEGQSVESGLGGSGFNSQYH
jgi:hypothetical protein